MARIRAPGIYFESSSRRQTFIELGETGVPAFLGVAERGPLYPVKLTNFKQFRQIYGHPLPGSYLASAIEGFFLNGGKTCYVVRVAHIFPINKDDEIARRARYEVLDRAGYPAFDFMAASEGSWGNEVSFQIQVPEKPRVQSFITMDLHPQSESAALRSTRGLEVGMVVCFRDGQEERYVTITRIKNNQIFWQGPIGFAFRSVSPTYVEPVEFNIFIFARDQKEKFLHLSLSRTAPRNVFRVINRESELIRVRSLGSHSEPPENLPENIDHARLRGGTDGLDGLSPQDFIGYNKGPGSRFGIGALEDNEEVDLLAAPDLHYALTHSKNFRSSRDVLTVHKFMVEHCEREGTCFALLDLPEKSSVEAAIDWRLQFDTAFAAIYYPWLVVVDHSRNNVRKLLPPSGHIAGLMAKCDREEGLFRAAANLPLEGVVDTSINLREEHLAELNDKGVNCIRSFPVRGIRPWGTRTLSNDPNWRYINIRRTISAIRRAVYQNTQWVVFETNGPDIRKTLESQIKDFLRGLWSSGYFKGESEAEAFYVLCDESNNPNEHIDKGLLVIDIGLAPARPAEFFSLRLEHTVEDRRLGDLSDME